jgi:hypothetical protein
MVPVFCLALNLRIIKQAELSVVHTCSSMRSGVIRLIMTILKKYWEHVLQFLREGMEALAANRLAARFHKRWTVELAQMGKG